MIPFERAMVVFSIGSDQWAISIHSAAIKARNLSSNVSDTQISAEAVLRGVWGAL